MSPSESDLRAALQRGEGDDLNVDQLVLAARAGAAHRRARLLSAAAVVAVVAGAGVGGALIANAGGSHPSSGTADGAALPVPVVGRNPSASSAAVPAPAYGAQSNAGLACSSVAYAVRRPAASSLAADAPLFREPVDTLLVCSYTLSAAHYPSQASPPSAVLLRGSQARQVVASLESAPKARPSGVCPDIRSAIQHELVLIGYTSTQSAAGTVTVSLAASPCDVLVTNGRTTRYGWNPPAAVAKLLFRPAVVGGGAGVANPAPSSTHS